ncbi:MAG: sugar-transfer associated ATP-grasp domain-containing protein [Bacilli bacterium]|nr:sugar-transfer associated ATP-grasp domain-containing protein [Bacilli bacterium]MDD4282375.1 sugar-transfer associated ATP-grasp domain-containing protein [Bacilli bacterium]MDD4718250.1 sugar-transfer associated ATP-grasp domain-containing protein [Bacilli bacterium]
MELFSFALKGNYKRYYNDLKEIGKATSKKPFIMFCDTVLCTLFLGSGMQDYLNFRFYEKKWKEKKEYVTIGSASKFYDKAANIKYAPFISNKVNFFKNYKTFVKRDMFDYTEGYDKYLEFIGKHNIFIKKPNIGLGGSNIEKINSKSIENHEYFYKQLEKEEAHLEEYIIQNSKWGKINPGSVNTLRVMTFAIDGKVDIFFTVARIGVGDSVVDNFHAGGISALVDVEKGILVGKGYTKKLETFTHHPLSNVEINGYKIPYFEEIKDLVKKAALVNDKIHVVGWDVAITENGPLIIEGNRGPGWDIVQVTLNKGGKYMIRKIKKEMKNHNLW